MDEQPQQQTVPVWILTYVGKLHLEIELLRQQVEALRPKIPPSNGGVFHRVDEHNIAEIPADA